MAQKDKKRRSDPILKVGPYARMRVIIALAVMIVAIVAIGYRNFVG